MIASWPCPGVAQPGRASEPPPRTVGDEDAVGVRPVRSHVSLTRLTVDTGVSPENHENWFGEFKIEVATSMRLRSPGPLLPGREEGRDLLRLYSRRTALKLSQNKLVLLHYDLILISQNPQRTRNQGERGVVPFELVLPSRKGLLAFDYGATEILVALVLSEGCTILPVQLIRNASCSMFPFNIRVAIFAESQTFEL